MGGVGIDYIDALVDQARRAAADENTSDVEFLVGDCRFADLGHEFDSVLCLYDVIGTYADDAENARIIECIYRHLKPGGFALLSVMNLELTQAIAKHVFSFETDADRLLGLRPSRTMERTGNIFNPDYYMLDTDKSVVYRKEQFELGQSLPDEVIVRDRRYTRAEIEDECHRAGLEVIWSRFVQSGHWEKSLDCTDPAAKEILVLCQRPA